MKFPDEFEKIEEKEIDEEASINQTDIFVRASSLGGSFKTTNQNLSPKKVDNLTETNLDGLSTS